MSPAREMPRKRGDDYVLGVDADELERLRFQHIAWVERAYALFARGGLAHGDVVLDLGCGPGFTSFELARVVGAGGRVIARDQSAAFLESLRAERDRLGLTQIEPSLGSVEELDLPPESLDAAYARWLFCWLPDPGSALTRVARCLRPGGAILLQEYFDWAAMKLVPRSAAFDRAVDACMQSWREAGGAIDIGELLPSLGHACGLELEHFAPQARLGRPGSLEWRWIEGFFDGYLPKLVERGLLTAEESSAALAVWAERAGDETSHCFTPTMVDVVLRRAR